jgi:nucleotide-binding universal stress UspA family protein
MNILIGIDGSDGGFEAVRQAARLAGAGDQLTLYYSPPEVRLRSGSQLDPQLLQRSRAAMAEVVFEAARGRLPEPLRAGVRTITGEQPPRTGLLQAAEDLKADLVAVGARGIGPIERLLLGSVSQAVVNACHVPVLVARRGGSDEASPWPRQVLVACECSDADAQIGAALSKLHWPPEARGRSITVIESMYAGEVPNWLEVRTRSPEVEAMSQAWVREHEADKRLAHDKLLAFCRTLPPAFQHEPIVAEGHPAEQILAAIARQSADLVVLGARPQGTVSKWVLGSTSEKVLHQSPCSVLVVRRRAKA